MAKEYSTMIRKVYCLSHRDSILFDGNFLDKNRIVINQTDSYQIQLPNRNNDIRITFSAAYFEGIQGLQYRFFLRNFDEDWSVWNYKTEKEYTNLYEGEYEFMVMSQNIFRKQSNMATFKFAIAPPWYRSYIMYTLYIRRFINPFI